jgi:hypothetical protein
VRPRTQSRNSLRFAFRDSHNGNQITGNSSDQRFVVLKIQVAKRPSLNEIDFFALLEWSILQRTCPEPASRRLTFALERFSCSRVSRIDGRYRQVVTAPCAGRHPRLLPLGRDEWLKFLGPKAVRFATNPVWPSSGPTTRLFSRPELCDLWVRDQEVAGSNPAPTKKALFYRVSGPSGLEPFFVDGAWNLSGNF